MTNNFEKWIQESAPAVEVNKTSKEIHLAVLKQRLRERDHKYAKRQNIKRQGGIMIMALMIVFIGGNVSELGSDGMDFGVVESKFSSEAKLLEVGFRKSSITGPASMNTETLRDLEVTMEFSEGIPISVESIGINGNESWSIKFEYDVNGSMLTGSRTVRDRPTKVTMDHLRFAKSELDLVLKMIEQGNLLPVSKKIESVDGCQFLINEYRFQSDNMGLVYYQKGFPIR